MHTARPGFGRGTLCARWPRQYMHARASVNGLICSGSGRFFERRHEWCIIGGHEARARASAV
eukprot:2325373-Prymnesium_polylepis.1